MKSILRQLAGSFLLKSRLCYCNDSPMDFCSYSEAEQGTMSELSTERDSRPIRNHERNHLMVEAAVAPDIVIDRDESRVQTHPPGTLAHGAPINVHFTSE